MFFTSQKSTNIRNVSSEKKQGCVSDGTYVVTEGIGVALVLFSVTIAPRASAQEHDMTVYFNNGLNVGAASFGENGNTKFNLGWESSLTRTFGAFGAFWWAGALVDYSLADGLGAGLETGIWCTGVDVALTQRGMRGRIILSYYGLLSIYAGTSEQGPQFGVLLKRPIGVK